MPREEGGCCRRIDELERKLSNAMIVSKQLATDAVVFRAQVTGRISTWAISRNFNWGTVEDYNTKQTTNSPIGQGLLGKKIGSRAHPGADGHDSL